MTMKPWLILGFAAQSCFFMRFAVQWISSEIKKESHIPISFWYLSLVGSIGLFIYAIHITDPVFIIGNALNFIVYIRNLVLISRRRDAAT